MEAGASARITDTVTTVAPSTGGDTTGRTGKP
jgi:hypothetical protein